MIAEQELLAEVSEAVEGFHITDERSANWLLRKLGNIEAEKCRVQRQAEEIIKGLNADAERLRYLYEGELQEWARRELERQGGRSKTLKALQGTCSFRTNPQSVRLVDEEAALFHAKRIAMPGAVETEERLRTGVYTVLAKRALSETGEVMPGIEVIPERETFSLRFGKEEGDKNREPPHPR